LNEPLPTLLIKANVYNTNFKFFILGEKEFYKHLVTYIMIFSWPIYHAIFIFVILKARVSF